VVADDGSGIVVADWVEGPPGPEWGLTVPLAPGTTWEGDGLLTTAGGARARWRLLTEDATVTVGEGPWSSTYGSVETATRLLVAGPLGGPVAWALTLGTGASPVLDGARLHGDLLDVAGAGLTVSWGDGVIDLEGHHPDRPGGAAARVVLR
ncbi:MAG: hypothetical protein KDB10_22730, partial [Acidimicrobiales bacterium]|nr:hypothetical protein [Acidimicrobiales bacterium]